MWQKHESLQLNIVEALNFYLFPKQYIPLLNNDTLFLFEVYLGSIEAFYDFDFA